MDSRNQTPIPVSDEEIVRRFRETGDGVWFAELFSRYGRKVYFACRGFSSDGGAAEDATQETFLRAYEKLHQFEGGDFCGWLMRIAKNICIDHWRKRRPESSLDESGGDGEGEPIQISTGAPDYDLRLSAERVWHEMKALSPEQRRCLEMKIEGYSYEETASRTGLSVDAVKSHLQNGRRMLWLRMEGTPVRAK